MVCSSKNLEGARLVTCGGNVVEVKSDEGSREVVDFVCEKCGGHSASPLVLKPTDSEARSRKDGLGSL